MIHLAMAWEVRPQFILLELRSILIWLQWGMLEVGFLELVVHVFKKLSILSCISSDIHYVWTLSYLALHVLYDWYLCIHLCISSCSNAYPWWHEDSDAWPGMESVCTYESSKVCVLSTLNIFTSLRGECWQVVQLSSAKHGETH